MMERALVAAGAMMLIAAPAFAASWTETSTTGYAVATPVTPPPLVVVAPPPAPDQVWVPGQWRRAPVWVAGHWRQDAAHATYVWVQGHYVEPAQLAWVPGHWVPRY
jgi:hypothetical protein